MPTAQEVLGEMPESMDDETFLNMMDGQNFGNSASFDANMFDDGGSDVDGELPKKKGSRGANFTVAEDEALVRAWQAISLDPITGDEQPGATYWKRIWDHFQCNNTSGIFRSQVSLNHRWQTIQVCCTRWADALAQVDRINPSGTNARDKVNIAQEMYKGKPKKKGAKQGKAFVLQHCWALLEHDEKWRTRNHDVPVKSKKSSNSCLPIEDDHVDLDSSDDEESGGRSPTPSSAPPKRLPGRKAETEKLKKGGESAYKESLDNMMKTRKELAADRKEFKTTRWLEIKEMEERRAAAEERRAAVEERRVAAEEAAKRLEQEQRIMIMDSTNLEPKAKAYLELMRDQVLAARSKEGFSMGGFIGGNVVVGGGNGGFEGNGGNGSSVDVGGNGGFDVNGGNGSSADFGDGDSEEQN
ncbi:unnamed protein product [Urochloa decumbens]|uniref:No apical meristem-associated C-terminal domain-containing protein n=1 Tax=Urochloa decumbens TaxID=240449 RepID=A0ABC9DHG9_9POAL